MNLLRQLCKTKKILIKIITDCAYEHKQKLSSFCTIVHLIQGMRSTRCTVLLNGVVVNVYRKGTDVAHYEFSIGKEVNIVVIKEASALDFILHCNNSEAV